MEASSFSVMIEKGHQVIKEASSLLSSLSPTSSSTEQQGQLVDNILDKLDDVLESLRNVPDEPATLTSDSLFSLNSSLNEKHLQWFDLTQQVVLSQCKFYLLLLRQDSHKNRDSMMNTLEILIRELISIHEWMKRRCISILSNPNYNIERKNEIQTKFLKKSMNDWEQYVSPVLEQISHITIENEYETELPKYLQNYLTKDGGVPKICVRNKNQQEGKTVLLNCENVNDKELIFREAPVCSQIITDSSENPLYRKIDYCHHCMRTIFSEKTISQSSLLQKILFTHPATTDKNALLPSSSPILSQYSHQQQHQQQICVKTKPVACNHCSLEVFCSETCRDQAWTQYHSLLCTRNSSGLQSASSTSEHPMILLERLSVKQGRTAPLMIAKMMAFVVNDVFMKIGLTNESDKISDTLSQLTLQLIETQLAKSMHIFQRFIQHEATHPFDTLAAQLIRESMELSLYHLPSNIDVVKKQEQENLIEYMKHHQDLSTSPLIRQLVEMVSDVRHYRSLHGLILQNCSTIHPITDIHLIAHENSTFSEQICKALNVSNFQQEATRKDELLQLSMKGMGAFAIHNCMNHSCEPTAVSVSDQNNHVLSVYAHHENGLKKGDEVLISYFDENAPYEERKRKLLEQYKFECHCPKCERESRTKK
ncbi:hypothetical protein FDP41_003601 [Naegleria fowleri]|uniref:SET domain-containing protein n=1 Tax=Naegleria fowleri TaxID=5763 RepID=A0A6A5BXF3_NAEFO|nr:uncharacterized protein FDP41_003601 [Naegleria fowleri]KAF0977609.1 hypothetical protein FDP41_003601 [Naegleria fowleri]